MIENVNKTVSKLNIDVYHRVKNGKSQLREKLGFFAWLFNCFLGWEKRHITATFQEDGKWQMSGESDIDAAVWRDFLTISEMAQDLIKKSMPSLDKWVNLSPAKTCFLERYYGLSPDN